MHQEYRTIESKSIVDWKKNGPRLSIYVNENRQMTRDRSHQTKSRSYWFLFYSIDPRPMIRRGRNRKRFEQRPTGGDTIRVSTGPQLEPVSCRVPRSSPKFETRAHVWTENGTSSSKNRRRVNFKRSRHGLRQKKNKKQKKANEEVKTREPLERTWNVRRVGHLVDNSWLSVELPWTWGAQWVSIATASSWMT